MSKKSKSDAEDFDIVEINGIRGVKRGNIVSAMIPVGVLIPTPWNPNQMSPDELKTLNVTIKENGFLDPLSVVPLEDGKTFSINAGEHRWKVAQDIGLKEIPCDIMFEDKWKDVDLQQFQSVKFNVIKGKMDPEKMVKLYNSVAAKHGSEKVSKLLGYTDSKGLDKIIKQVTQQIKETLPPEVAKQFEEEAKEARSIGDLNKIIQHIFKEHGDTVNYSFIVFAFGGKEHTYIAANPTVNKALKIILAAAKEKHLDVNDLLADAFLATANRLGGKSGN